MTERIREQGLKNSWKEDDNRVLYHQGLLYVPEVIRTKLISSNHDDPLESHFEIDKTRELIARKYYWPFLRTNVKAYVKGCNMCLASNAVCHKPYRDLRSLPVPTHRWKDLLIDLVTGLPVSTNRKGKTYDSILVIVDWLTKMIHYKLVKVTIDAPGFAEVTIDVVVRQHRLPKSIVTNCGSVFTSKFWSSLFYFLEIQKRLSTTFRPQADGQIERQNRIMEAYLRVFVNY